jgi:predicted transcriptional regulator
MKAVIMSLKPRWWEKMLSGEKTLEIRKTAPAGGAGDENPWPLLVLVYVSGTGEVRGQFTCHGWIKTNLFNCLAGRSCVPIEDLEKYAAGKSLCGWTVKDPQKYDTPRPLAEFGLERPPMSWQYIEIPDAAEVG